MKVEFTEKQMKKCLGQKRHKAAVQVLRKAEQTLQFTVGDVIVGYTEKDQLIMQNDNMYQRWVVVHKDDKGVRFAKKMMVNGNLGQGIYPLAAIDEVDRFELDPDFLDLLLLGKEEEYDPSKSNREIANKRAKLRKINAERKLKWKDVVEAQNIIDTWQIGDTLYWCRTNTPNSNHIEPYKVVAINKKKIDYSIKNEARNFWHSMPFDGYSWQEREHRKNQLEYMYTVVLKNSKYTKELQDYDTYLWAWYTTKPSTTEDI